MLFGIRGSIIYYDILMYGAYVLIALSVIFGIQHWASLVVFISFPMMLNVVKQMHTADKEKPELVQELDKNTAQVVMIFMLLLVIGNFAGGFIAR